MVAFCRASHICNMFKGNTQHGIEPYCCISNYIVMGSNDILVQGYCEFMTMITIIMYTLIALISMQPFVTSLTQ